MYRTTNDRGYVSWRCAVKKRAQSKAIYHADPEKRRTTSTAYYHERGWRLKRLRELQDLRERTEARLAQLQEETRCSAETRATRKN